MPRVNRGPRNSVNDRPGRWKLLLRRQRKYLWPAGWLMAALIVTGSLALTLRSGTQGGSVVTLRDRIGAATAAGGLRIQDVIIEGRANTPEPLLRAAIGVTRGDPTLGFSVEDARKRIETLSWVETATVERRLPGTIVVNLAERRPFAIWQNQGKFVLIDRSGEIVANQDVSSFDKLPLVVGPGAPAAAAALLDALTARPALQSRLTAAVRVGERRWNLRLQGGMDVMLPEGAEIAALDRLMVMQQDHALLDRPLQAVDMRLPDRLVLRPLASAPAAPKKPS